MKIGITTCAFLIHSCKTQKVENRSFIHTYLATMWTIALKNIRNFAHLSWLNWATKIDKNYEFDSIICKNTILFCNIF